MNYLIYRVLVIYSENCGRMDICNMSARTKRAYCKFLCDVGVQGLSKKHKTYSTNHEKEHYVLHVAWMGSD